jgi:CheY-like chemotaxis protein
LLSAIGCHSLFCGPVRHLSHSPDRTLKLHVFVHISKVVHNLHSELPMASTPSNKNTKTILVVDDEDATRRLITLILRQGGYAVLEAADSEGAENIHRHNRGKIDLLLTDVSLPGPNGPELAAALRRSEPDLQVLFMSGLPQSEEDMPVLRKPFGVAELLHQVRTHVEQPVRCEG